MQTAFSAARRRLTILSILAIASLFVFTGCSKDDDDVVGAPGAGASMMVHHEGDSTAVLFDDLPSFQVDDLEAILLSSFVDTFLVPPYRDDDVMYDLRSLYGYRIEGTDGFSASVKGYTDNTWEHMGLGYLLTASRQVVFPDDVIDLAGAYNVKDAARIILRRKIDVVYSDTTAMRELADLAIVQVENHEDVLEDAIRLYELVETTIVADPSTKSYNIVALDGFGPATPMTWTQFRTGYWLLESKRTIFTDPSLAGGAYELRILDRVLVQ